MFHFKDLLKICLLVAIISLKFSNIKADSQECNKILIEGEEKTLLKIFKDFGEIKNVMEDLKTNIELLREYNNNNLTKTDLKFFDIRLDKLPEKCKDTSTKAFDCASATACTKRNGIYEIKVPQYSPDPFYVECDTETENGDWLLIQRRQDGSVDFYRNWEDYEQGFGDIDGEFFIGLKKLYALTNYNGPQELLIIMEGENATKAYAQYNNFAIGNATESYKLKKLGKYSGTAGNSLQHHVGMKFTTKDRDNDLSITKNCAVSYKGAWWYNSCHKSTLNGKYKDGSTGVIWSGFRGFTESLSYVKMMIRRRRT